MIPKSNVEQDISSIRMLMERSSRFISLSGLSGVLSGVYAIAGAAVAYYLIYYPNSPFGSRTSYVNETDVLIKLLVLAVLVLVASLATGTWLTVNKARRQGVSYWDNNSRRFLANVSIPLIAGGVFMMILLFRGYYGIVAPSCLLFYGLALINGSSYTLNEIRYLGLCEIVLGLVCSMLPGYGLICWAAGFGVLHIVYGLMMYNRYDK
jgi:hypothetical protein